MPTNNSIREKLLHNANLEGKQALPDLMNTFVLTIALTLVFSLLYLVLVSFFPTVIYHNLFFVGPVVISILFICVLVLPYSIIVKIIVGVLFVLMLLVTGVSIYKFTKSLGLNFLLKAVGIMKKKPLIYLYVPFFLLLLVGFIVLIIFELSAFWTVGDLNFNSENSIFWESD